MSNLVVVAYPDEYRAAEVLATVQRMRSDYLIDIDDACYVTKDAQGKLKLHQATNLTGAAATMGGMWGMLIGLLFFAPFLGLAIGAGVGALTSKLTDYGIDDNFAKRLTATLQPNSSAIFVLVRTATVDKVVPELAKYGGTVMQTSMPKESEEKLQAALRQGGAQQLEQAQVIAETPGAAGAQQTQTPPSATPQ